MSLLGCNAILGMGGFFVLLGIVFFISNRRGKNKYYENILLTERDVKEAITHQPERSWLNAFKIGAIICFIIGCGLLIAGGILWLKGFCG